MFRVLFLDLDYVINSDTYLKNKIDAPYPICEFDPKAVKRVNNILGYCDQLVLSSDWRFTENIDNILREIGISTDYVDNMLLTPYLGHIFDNHLRGHEVDFTLKYIMQDQKKVNYVILDDMDEWLDFQKVHWVKTRYKDGLTDELMEKAVEILMDTGLYVK